MRVRAVSKDKLREIASETWVDHTHKPYAEGDITWVPVRNGEPCDRDLPGKDPV